MKTCTKCGEEKTDDDFSLYKNRKGEPRRRSICKVCISERQSQYAKARKIWLQPHKQAYQKEYQKAHRKPRATIEYGETLICIKCGGEKPLIYEHFRPYKNKNGDLRWYRQCRECERAYTRKYCKTNEPHKKPHVRTYQKNYGKINKDKIRSTVYERKHGITFTEVKAMAEKQEHKCAICENPIDFKDRRSFNVDHCHTNGNIRGILCSKCNRGLGFFNDNPELLTRAINYLTL